MPQIRRRSSSASTTHHGIGVQFVELDFLDAFAGCPAHSRLANVYLHSLDGGVRLGRGEHATLRATGADISICLSHPSHRGTSDSEPGLIAFRERQTATDFGLGLSLPVRLTLAAAARTPGRRPATGKVLRQVASSIFKLPSQSRSVLSHAFVRATKSRATLLTMLAAYMACLVYI